MPADQTNAPVPPAAEQPLSQGLDSPVDDESWEEEQDGGSERTIRAIVAAVVLVIVVILVLLLLRACSTTTKTGSVGEKTIVAVPAQVRVENVVSVWLKSGSSIREVLAAAKVRSTSTRAMGDGLYFVFLPDLENPDAAVRRLKRNPQVNDAGFVYDQAAEPIKSSP